MSRGKRACRVCRARMLAILFRNKSCVSGSWKLENDTTHGQAGSKSLGPIHCSRPPADQSGKRVASCRGEVARHARHRILARMSRVSDVRRGCHEDAMMMLRGNCSRGKLYTTQESAVVSHVMTRNRGATSRTSIVQSHTRVFRHVSV